MTEHPKYDINIYIEKRLDPLIDHLDNQVKKWKFLLNLAKIVQLVLTSSIPVLSTFVESNLYILHIISLFGAITTIISGLTSYSNISSKIDHDTIMLGQLKQEKIYFLMKAKPYIGSKNDDDILLVERVEEIITKHNQNNEKLKILHRKRK